MDTWPRGPTTRWCPAKKKYSGRKTELCPALCWVFDMILPPRELLGFCLHLINEKTEAYTNNLCKTTRIIRPPTAWSQAQRHCPFHVDMCHLPLEGATASVFAPQNRSFTSSPNSSTHGPWRKATCPWVQE